MIDSLEMLRTRIESESVYREWGLPDAGYGLVTLHRPANVDDPDTLQQLCELLIAASKRKPILFPIHPRTRKNLERFELMGLLSNAPSVHLTEPQSYIRFMNMVFHCAFVITDSGGVQEETSYLGIPCMTLRPNTERPVTVTKGTNRLFSISALRNEIENRGFTNNRGVSDSIEMWDGRAAVRVVKSIKEVLAV